MRVAAGSALCLVGCWSATEAPIVAPVQNTAVVTVEGGGARGSSPSSVSRRRTGGIPPHSVWEGTYVCNQGLSSVRFTLDVDRAGNATARYDFGPVPTNPTVPNGAYSLTGVVRAQDGGGFAGDFEATEWIVQPTNYFMVPLSIESGDGKTMTGTIRHSSCHSFQTTRIE